MLSQIELGLKSNVVTAPEIGDLLSDARGQFEGQRKSKILLDSSRKVRDWLVVNKQKTDDYGNAIGSKGAWWSVAGLENTDDARRLDLRLSLFRKLLFGHGMRRLLQLLIEEGVIPSKFDDKVRKLTGFAYMALWEELSGYVLSPKHHEHTLALKDLVDRFELARGNNPARLAKSALLPMAQIGLVTAYHNDNNRHYRISLGPVGRVFHSEVFTPVLNHFENTLKGVAK